MKKRTPHRTARYYYLRFIRLKGSPDVLARGVAIGTFIGITPTIPFHTILILALCLALRGSKIAGILVSWLVSNPLTFIIQYYLSWLIGSRLTGSNLSWERINTTIETLTSQHGFMESVNLLGQLGIEALASLILGGCVLAIPFMIAGYFLSFRFFSLIRKKRQKNQLPEDNVITQINKTDS